MKNIRCNATLGSRLLSLSLTGALAIGVLLSAPGANAQSNLYKVKAEIPFQFEMGRQHMPAGVYEIDVQTNEILLLRSATSKANGFIITTRAEVQRAPDEGRVVFNKYGSRYFLSELWVGGETHGHECIAGSAEKEMRMAQTAAPELVQLALK